MSRADALSRALLFTAFASVAVAGFGACSNDSNNPAEERPTGRVTLPPAGLDDCQQVYENFWFVMLSPFTPALSMDTQPDDPNQQLNVEQVFDDLSVGIPADLQDDLAILSDAYIEYDHVLAENNYDFRSPEAEAARQAFDAPEITQAMENIDTSFLESCPGIT